MKRSKKLFYDSLVPSFPYFGKEGIFIHCFYNTLTMSGIWNKIYMIAFEKCVVCET